MTKEEATQPQLNLKTQAQARSPENRITLKHFSDARTVEETLGKKVAMAVQMGIQPSGLCLFRKMPCWGPCLLSAHPAIQTKSKH